MRGDTNINRQRNKQHFRRAPCYTVLFSSCIEWELWVNNALLSTRSIFPAPAFVLFLWSKEWQNTTGTPVFLFPGVYRIWICRQVELSPEICVCVGVCVTLCVFAIQETNLKEAWVNTHTHIKGDVQQRAHNKHANHSCHWRSSSPACAEPCCNFRERWDKITGARPTPVCVCVCVCVRVWTSVPPIAYEWFDELCVHWEKIPRQTKANWLQHTYSLHIDFYQGPNWKLSYEEKSLTWSEQWSILMVLGHCFYNLGQTEAAEWRSTIRSKS